MESYDVYISLAVAAAAGFLIGVEREQSAARSTTSYLFLGGARTHPLVALTGGVSVLVARETGWAVLALPFATVAAFLVVNYVQDVRAMTGDRGFTSETSFMLSFLLGALALTNTVIQPPERKYLVVAAVAVLVTLLLSAKPVLNMEVRELTREDLVAALKFLVLVVIALPLLPDRSYGPLQALNPRQIGVLVVLTVGISFAGYVALRLLGPKRGLALTGFVGGFASSTGVTLAMSSRARAERQLVDSLALAIVLASSVMFIRMGILVAVVDSKLLRGLAPPLGLMAGTGLVIAYFLHRRSKPSEGGGLKLWNPVSLAQALGFAVFFVIVLVGSKAAAAYLGAPGPYAAAVVAGSADVDAITLSIARLAKGELSQSVAVGSIFLAGAANTIVKGIIGATRGGSALGKRLGIAFAIMLAVGGAAVLFAK